MYLIFYFYFENNSFQIEHYQVLQTIKQSYGKHPYFNEVFPLLEKCINIDTPYFCEINIAIIKEFCDALNIHPEYIRSKDLGIDELKSDLILDICKKVKADTYIAGPSGRDYLNMQDFEKSGIMVKFNDYVHPTYQQKKTDKFIDHLSALDLFMNVGFIEAKKIIMLNNEGVNSF